MTPTHAKQEHPPGGGEQTSAASAVAGAIGRLIALASIYPPGHPRCAEIEEQVLPACRVPAHAPALELMVTQDSLTAGDNVLPLDDTNIARLHDTLHAIAIVSLRIDADVAAGDLQEFAKQLLIGKAQVQRATGFKQFDITDRLPDSIHIVHRAFGSRLVSESVAASAEGARVAVLQRFQGKAPTDDLAVAAELAGSLAARIVERVEQGVLGPPDSGTRGRALDEVLDLCAHAMQHAIEQMLGAGEPLSELARLAENVEKAVAVAKDKQGVEVLLDVLQLVADDLDLEYGPQGADDPDRSPDAEPAGDRERYELTPEQLEAELMALVADPRPFVEPELERQEWLTIVLHLVQHVPADQLLPVIGALPLPSDVKWTAEEIALIVRGCAAVASERKLTLVDRLLPTFLEFSRRLPNSGLLDFLVPLCEAVPGDIARIWPHIVNELLHDAVRSAGVPAKLRERLWQLLAPVAGPARDGGIKRLLRLDFVRGGKLPASVLDDPDANLRAVLADLLSSPEADPLGRQLHQELRGQPSRWPGAEALLASPQYDGNVRQLLQHALRAGIDADESVELQLLSARILVDVLRELPPERRNEPWVPAALLALGKLAKDGAPVLGAVLRRRWLLWSQWPSACRRAARTALGAIKASARERK
ncbi:MAG TPA: hypothetical protein VF384_10000 [Planctomycetota bacterium]